MPADLHTHTYYSDGLDAPADLVRHANKVGLTQIAITDHDDVEGLPEAIEAGKQNNIRVIAGIELSAGVEGREVHLLGYFIELGNTHLLAELTRLKNIRRERIRKIVQQLEENGVRLPVDQIFELAGKGTAGRPHVARALIQADIAKDMRDAFQRFLVPGRPGYVSHTTLSGSEALRLIHQAGGVSVLAHPVFGGVEEVIGDLVVLGLGGIEVYYDGYTKEQMRRLEKTADEFQLLRTGGSDYHGEGGRSRPVELGAVKVDDKLVDKLENAARRR